MNQPFSVLGLAYRAGKAVSGDQAVLNAIRRNEAKLVIVAEDASQGTLKKYRDKCTFYHIPMIQTGTSEQLGRSIGKINRVVIAVTDNGFAELLRKSLQNIERGDEY